LPPVHTNVFDNAEWMGDTEPATTVKMDAVTDRFGRQFHSSFLHSILPQLVFSQSYVSLYVHV